MKTVKFLVTLEFSENLSESNDLNQVAVIAGNLAQAIRDGVNTRGIAPEDSDAFTVGFSIIEPDGDIEIYESM